MIHVVDQTDRMAATLSEMNARQKSVVVKQHTQITETIVGVGFHPLSEHYQEDFADTVATTGADRLLVKDC